MNLKFQANRRNVLIVIFISIILIVCSVGIWYVMPKAVVIYFSPLNLTNETAYGHNITIEVNGNQIYNEYCYGDSSFSPGALYSVEYGVTGLEFNVKISTDLDNISGEQNFSVINGRYIIITLGEPVMFLQRSVDSGPRS